MELDDFLSDQAAAGKLDSRGSFTVDLARASDKLRQFQLREPGFFLLKAIQGFVGLGCRTIELRSSGKDWFLEARYGSAPEPFVLRDPRRAMDSILEGDGPDHDLNVALRCALALEPSSVGLDRFHGGQVRRVQLSQAGELELYDGETQPAECLRFYIKGVGKKLKLDPLRPRLAFAVPSIEHKGERLNKAEWGKNSISAKVLGAPNGFFLAERYILESSLGGRGVAYAPRGSHQLYVRPRTLRGEDANAPAPPVGTVAGFLREHVVVGAAGAAVCRAMIGLSGNLGGPGSVQFVKNGVCLDLHHADLGLPGVVAICSADGLAVDLSEFQVASNDEYHRTMRALRWHVRSMVANLAVNVERYKCPEPGGGELGGVLLALLGCATLQPGVIALAYRAGRSMAQSVTRGSSDRAARNAVTAFLNKHPVPVEGDRATWAMP